MRTMVAIVLAFLVTTLCSANVGLSKSELAEFSKNVVVPLPSEVFMALDNLSKVDWDQVVTYNSSSDYVSNYMIALNLGARVADGFFAIQAKDKKNTIEMLNVSQDLARNFGAKSEVFTSKEKIFKFENEKNWYELRQALDKIYYTVKGEMRKYHPDFVVLASLGGWLEGLNIVSKTLTENYNKDASSIVYQLKLIDYFIAKLEKLDVNNANNKAVDMIKKNMVEIRALCNVGAGNPVSKGSMKELYTLSSELVNVITKGE